MGATAISGATAEPVSMQETLNWLAFSRHRRPPNGKREKILQCCNSEASVYDEPDARIFFEALKN
jgi:hypothetical protein